MRTQVHIPAPEERNNYALRSNGAREANPTGAINIRLLRSEERGPHSKDHPLSLFKASFSLSMIQTLLKLK